MPYAKKIVLRSRWGYHPGLDTLVADFRRDGVLFVGVVGKDCDIIEDIIDELCQDATGGGAPAILTSSHVDGTVEEAVSFAEGLGGAYTGGAVEVVEF